MTRRRQSRSDEVFAFRTTTATAQRIRAAAAADDRQVGAFLRRLVERALKLPRRTETRSPETT